MYGPLKNIVNLFFREGDKGHGNKAFLRQHDFRQSDDESTNFTNYVKAVSIAVVLA